ncbi:hypothetical protein ACIRG4_06325 [Streptomyces sp. NPDC102395]|uniref:hypothetical protein n=1 Tax=Streptomyces sp. NPDC102395 TaxID=3366168 RepID=UPI00381B0B2B
MSQNFRAGHLNSPIGLTSRHRLTTEAGGVPGYPFSLPVELNVTQVGVAGI